MGAKSSRLNCSRQGNTSEKPLKYSGVLFRNRDSQGSGKLEIAEEEIVFRQKFKTALVWPIRSIRRYGCRKGAFSFESGRRCASGPAFYTFQAKDAHGILTKVQEIVSQIVQAHNFARVVHLDNSAPVVPNSDSPPRLVSQSDSQLTNQYMNCDRHGRVLEWDGPGLGSENTLPNSPVPQKPDIVYADLDLAALNRSARRLRRSRRGQLFPSNNSLPVGHASPQSVRMAKSKTVGVPVLDQRVDRTVYVKLDLLKTTVLNNMRRESWLR